jgi:DivIVA domain-containing protein
VSFYDEVHMEITPQELRDTEIHSEIRGYSRDEVNDLLERAAQAIEASNQRVTQLQDRLSSAQSEAVRTRETEDILHRTLLLAQRAADEAVAEATAKSKQMLDDAETNSRRLIADSEAEARLKGETERRRLEEEIVELAGRRDTLLTDVDSLTQFETEYRERMLRSLETDLTQLRTRSTSAPGARPEPSDVEIPAEVSAPATAPEPEPEPATATAPAPEPEVEEPAAAAASPARDSNDDAPAATTNGRTAPANDADASRAAETHDAAGGPETSELDMSTLFEPAPEAPRVAVRDDMLPGERGRAAASSPVATGFQPLDLGDPDEFEGDILDDDAFFATLRDAVTDEAPLGPRDEADDDLTGEHRFFDQDADRGSFRDVFRRRR